ncbi:MAG: sigma-70 family RNA polymerase sigma factor [Planctomycetota bacterium]
MSDAAALHAALERDAAFLRRLAGRLVGDAAEAEDLAQDAALALLERPPEDLRAPRALFARVLGRRAANRHREGLRRRFRESASATPDAVDPRASESRAALLAELAAAVSALDAPLRRAIVMRYHEGRSTAEIAAAEGIAPRAVETRLRRAVAELRRRLDDGERDWRAGLLPLVASSGAGGSVPAPRGLLAGRAPLLAGVAGLVAVGAVVWSVLGSGGDAPEPPRRKDASAAGPARAALVEGSALEARRPRSLPPAPSRTGRGAEAPSLTVVWSDGTPASGILVRVTDLDEPDGDFRARDRRTDAEGRLALEVAGPRREYRALRGGALVADGRADEVLVVPRGRDVSGVVVDAAGRPVAGAALWISQDNDPDRGGIAGTTDAEGRFAIRSVGGYSIAARAAAHGASARYPLVGLPVEASDRRLVLAVGAPPLRGRVVDEKGRPVAGVRGRLAREHGEGARENETPPALDLVADASGRFVVEGLAAGRVELRLRAPGRAPGRHLLEIAAAGTDEVREFVMPVEARLRGRVIDAAGRPRAGARIDVGSAHGGAFRAFEARGAVSDGAGRFVVGELGPGSWPLLGHAAGSGALRDVVVVARAGEIVEREFRFPAPMALAGSLRDVAGRPLAGWSIRVQEEDWNDREFDHLVTDERGWFGAPSRRDRPTEIEVYDPRWKHFPVLRVKGLRPGGKEVEIVVDERTAHAAFLAGRVVAPGGEPLAGARVTVFGPDLWIIPDLETDGAGRFRVGPFPAGEGYRVSIALPDRGDRRFGPFALEARGDLELGDLTFAAAGRIEVSVLDARGEPIAAPHGSLVDEHSFAISCSATGNRVVSPPLAPGTYRLSVRAPGRASVEREVRVTGGETTRLTLRLE